MALYILQLHMHPDHTNLHVFGPFKEKCLLLCNLGANCYHQDTLDMRIHVYDYDVNLNKY